MSEILKTIGFVLIAVGTSGLLFNEFVVDLSRGATIAFACLNVLGLIIIAVIAWTIRKGKAD